MHAGPDVRRGLAPSSRRSSRRCSGVGQVTVGGSSLPAVRVELNPHALYKYGIGPEDVRAAITATNVNRPKGSLEEGDRHWQILANDQAKKAARIPADRRRLPATAPPVRLSDVAEVVDSVQDLRNAGSAERQALGAADHQPPAERQHHRDRGPREASCCRCCAPRSRATSTSTWCSTARRTIRGSLRETERTLLIAIALVILVVFAVPARLARDADPDAWRCRCR